MVAMELAASCKPFRKSKINATAMSPRRRDEKFCKRLP
jgi:hypothetical protein